LYKIPANTLFVGKVVEYMPSCHSTNDSARELLLQHDTSEGTVVITDNQTAGKGQRGNSWFSAEGANLTMSLIMKPNFLTVSKQFYLNMISSLAVKRVLNDRLPDANSQVKWPNDVLLNNRKVCGILIENGIKRQFLEHSVVGIGLNVNQKTFGLATATSMYNEIGIAFSLQSVFEKLLGQFEALYLKLKAERYSEIKDEYLQNLVGFNQWRKYRSEYVFDGQIVDVLDSGQLKLATQQGDKLFDFKEIEFIWN
jgi:BirA family biotin operon repressor/biotin-[acetyl-CoA-carboxylase] ligase